MVTACTLYVSCSIVQRVDRAFVANANFDFESDIIIIIIIIIILIIIHYHSSSITYTVLNTVLNNQNSSLDAGRTF